MSCVSSLGISEELSPAGPQLRQRKLIPQLPTPATKKKIKGLRQKKKNELGFKRVNVAMNAKVHGGVSGFIYMCVCVSENES